MEQLASRGSPCKPAARSNPERISNDDVYFMGFNPVWTRPEWFICEVIAVAPPNVRPSVKHDGHTRAEDDMTFILMYIFKFNEKIKALIAQNSEERMIEHHVSLLQYYVATLIDGFSSPTRVTMPLTVSRWPMYEARTWRSGMAFSLTRGMMSTS